MVGVMLPDAVRRLLRDYAGNLALLIGLTSGVALLFYRMPLTQALGAAGFGFVYGLWPIAWIIIGGMLGAVGYYKLSGTPPQEGYLAMMSVMVGGPLGMLAGAAVIFFAYIGFDAVSTVAEETRNPSRDLPIGIIGSLIACTGIYVVVALVFTGIGAAVLVAANAYLIGREYFELAASRHMSVAEARALRRANAPSIFMAGLLPALFALVPLLNLLMPLFATSYFIHVFKRAAATSA
mgnify:CR=1 FL=1